MSAAHKLSTPAIEVDLALVYDVAANDPEYIKLMLQTFLKHFPTTIEKMEQALAAKDWDALYKAAHSAKSSLSVIQVGDLLEVVKLIEKNARTNTELHALEALVQKVGDQYKLAETLIRSVYFAEQ